MVGEESSRSTVGANQGGEEGVYDRSYAPQREPIAGGESSRTTAVADCERRGGNTKPFAGAGEGREQIFCSSSG
eukprot:7708566-Pyramimonas_sp.AAC.1